MTSTMIARQPLLTSPNHHGQPWREPWNSSTTSIQQYLPVPTSMVSPWFLINHHGETPPVSDLQLGAPEAPHPIICSSPHCFMTTAIRAMRSAACWPGTVVVPGLQEGLAILGSLGFDSCDGYFPTNIHGYIFRLDYICVSRIINGYGYAHLSLLWLVVGYDCGWLLWCTKTITSPFRLWLWFHGAGPQSWESWGWMLGGCIAGGHFNDVSSMTLRIKPQESIIFNRNPCLDIHF